MSYLVLELCNKHVYNNYPTYFQICIIIALKHKLAQIISLDLLYIYLSMKIKQLVHIYTTTYIYVYSVYPNEQ